MGVTNFDQLDAVSGRIKIGDSLPTTPLLYYGQDRIESTEWKGGETFYLTTDNRLYIQNATSGTTATWKRLAAAFATSTTSSSTSSSSTSSSTSTSTSTSSSTSSSSSSSSSTTTMA